KVLTAMAEPDQFIRRSMDAFGNILRGDGATVVHAIYPYHQTGDPLANHRDADGLLIINPDAKAMQCGPKQVMCIINTAIETAVAMSTGYDVVSADSEQGGFIAGQHLRRAGVKVACFIGCPPYDGVEGSYDRTSGTRLHGFEQGWGEALPPQQRLYCKS